MGTYRSGIGIADGEEEGKIIGKDSARKERAYCTCSGLMKHKNRNSQYCMFNQKTLYKHLMSLTQYKLLHKYSYLPNLLPMHVYYHCRTCSCNYLCSVNDARPVKRLASETDISLEVLDFYSQTTVNCNQLKSDDS